MIVATHQPYFAPYPGFFQKAAAADILVLLDSVQFPQGTTWLQRNRFKNDHGELRLTVPVWKKGRGKQRINEVEILWKGRWVEKHLQSLKQAYSRAPYFSEHFGFLQRLYQQGPKRLVDLNLACLDHAAAHLGLETPMRLLSELGASGGGTDLIMEICRRLGARAYLAQKGAEKFLRLDRLQEAGLEIFFFRPETIIYPQLWGRFLPNLSSFDLLWSCGSRSPDLLCVRPPVPLREFH